MKKTRMILFTVVFFTWVLLNWSLDLEHIVIAVLVGILVSFISGDMFEGKPKNFKNISRYFWFLYYIPLFIWECTKANIDAAYRLAHPDLPIHPGIVKVKTSLRSDIGLSFLANSLTLQPGTMTVDIDKEAGFLYVHWMEVKTQDVQKATELIVGKFERILKRIFE
jgi:multicomponent Na+:H+ antiporter subunit E